MNDECDRTMNKYQACLKENGLYERITDGPRYIAVILKAKERCKFEYLKLKYCVKKLNN